MLGTKGGWLPCKHGDNDKLISKLNIQGSRPAATAPAMLKTPNPGLWPSATSQIGSQITNHDNGHRGLERGSLGYSENHTSLKLVCYLVNPKHSFGPQKPKKPLKPVPPRPSHHPTVAPLTSRSFPPQWRQNTASGGWGPGPGEDPGLPRGKILRKIAAGNENWNEPVLGNPE